MYSKLRQTGRTDIFNSERIPHSNSVWPTVNHKIFLSFGPTVDLHSTVCTRVVILNSVDKACNGEKITESSGFRPLRTALYYYKHSLHVVIMGQ